MDFNLQPLIDLARDLLGTDDGVVDLNTLFTYALAVFGIKKGAPKVKQKVTAKRTAKAQTKVAEAEDQSRLAWLCEKVESIDSKLDAKIVALEQNVAELTERVAAIEQRLSEVRLDLHPRSQVDAPPIPRTGPPPIPKADLSPAIPGDTDAGPLPYRTNNPGALRYDGTAWKGLDDQPVEITEGNGRFCRFKSPVWGIRACIRVARNYRKNHGIRTFAEHATRWAPSSDNNDPAGYASFVAGQLGLKPHDEIPLDTLQQRADFARATGLKEAGRIVLSWPESVWLEGAKAEQP